MLGRWSASVTSVRKKGVAPTAPSAVASSEDMGEWQELWDNITQEGRDIQKLAMEQPECADRTDC